MSTTQINGLDQLAPELLAIARHGIFDGMEILGAEGVRMVQDNITTPYNGHPAAVFTGNLAASPRQAVMQDDVATRLIIGSSGAAAAYAPPVETGARPHLPPVEELVPWVMKKFGAADEKQALSLAWAVAKSIAKKGTQGHEMFSRALTSLEPLTVPTIERAMAARFAAAGYGGAA